MGVGGLVPTAGAQGGAAVVSVLLSMAWPILSSRVWLRALGVSNCSSSVPGKAPPPSCISRSFPSLHRQVGSGCA